MVFVKNSPKTKNAADAAARFVFCPVQCAFKSALMYHCQSSGYRNSGEGKAIEIKYFYCTAIKSAVCP